MDLIVRCKGCANRPNCSISKGAEWYCADAKQILNEMSESKDDPLLTLNYSDILENDYQDLKSFSYIPPACRACGNHPGNGGSGFCSCVLGGHIIRC